MRCRTWMQVGARLPPMMEWRSELCLIRLGWPLRQPENISMNRSAGRHRLCPQSYRDCPRTYVCAPLQTSPSPYPSGDGLPVKTKATTQPAFGYYQRGAALRVSRPSTGDSMLTRGTSNPGWFSVMFRHRLAVDAGRLSPRYLYLSTRRLGSLVALDAQIGGLFCSTKTAGAQSHAGHGDQT
jgi:hypothetical protein